MTVAGLTVFFVRYLSPVAVLEDVAFIEQGKVLFSSVYSRSSVQQRTRDCEQKPDSVL